MKEQMKAMAPFTPGELGELFQDPWRSQGAWGWP